jgi:4-hydroxy-L-threonine phosphate dehydrogenase PdxA
VDNAKPIIAIATGDVAGVGPEISVKAALEPSVADVCRPLLVCDPGVLERHAQACGIKAKFSVIARIQEADWLLPALKVLACPAPGLVGLEFGTNSASSGRASLAFCRAAIRAALAGDVNAVVAAPQNQTSISLAGVAFDGYPSFVARETGLAPDEVYLMLCFDRFRIVHCTLHASVSRALAAISRHRVFHAIRATDQALKQLGLPAARICVGGLNPHAGEGGLFGREEIDIIGPAIADAAAEGMAVVGPFGTDTMFHRSDIDAFVVMLHDQGHIAAKLLARNATAGLAIGSPILFSSVAHGSAHDIAGRGVASPRAMIEAICRLATAGPSANR